MTARDTDPGLPARRPRDRPPRAARAARGRGRHRGRRRGRAGRRGDPGDPRLRPDVAILDGRLPDGSGIEVCREVRAADPSIKGLILTSYDDDEAMFNAILAGRRRLRAQADRRRRAAQRHPGGRPGPVADRPVGRGPGDRPDAQRPGGRPAGSASLTPQEKKILVLIAEGLTNRQIGERMFLAEKTVKNHVTSVLAKLGVERRTQAAVLASKLRHAVTDAAAEAAVLRPCGPSAPG